MPTQPLSIAMLSYISHSSSCHRRFKSGILESKTKSILTKARWIIGGFVVFKTTQSSNWIIPSDLPNNFRSVKTFWIHTKTDVWVQPKNVGRGILLRRYFLKDTERSNFCTQLRLDIKSGYTTISPRRTNNIGSLGNTYHIEAKEEYPRLKSKHWSLATSNYGFFSMAAGVTGSVLLKISKTEERDLFF